MAPATKVRVESLRSRSSTVCAASTGATASIGMRKRSASRATRNADRLQDVLPQVIVAQHFDQPLPHPRRIEADLLLGPFGQREEHLIHQRGHHGGQPPRADVLHALVGDPRHARDLLDRIGAEFELKAFRGAERLVLLGERILRLAEDPDEILLLSEPENALTKQYQAL